MSQPAHFVTELSPVEQHGCPGDTCPDQCTALAPFKELQVHSTDLKKIILIPLACWQGHVLGMAHCSHLSVPFPGSGLSLGA